jgi:aminopeptidase-like protein
VTTNEEATGQRMYRLIRDLYPICRSITGDGFRESLRILQDRVALTTHEVPSGTKVFDWTVPKEWNIRDAYVEYSRGERIIDFQQSNLHVVSYSIPIRRKIPLRELKDHLHTLPDHPDWIPYRTSYYTEEWGFCLSHRQFLDLEEGEYEVSIDSTLEDGHLTYGEYYLPGESPHEVLISCHSCHPSLCNDNLSAMSVAVELAEYLSQSPRRYSYRFLFIPGTIGSITWLALNEAAVPNIKHGLLLSCLGDAGSSTYKHSRRGDALIDRAAKNVLEHSGAPFNILEFVPYGYDERQFCSPGFDLPLGCLMRTPNGKYPEYHTSADNLDLVHPDALADSFEKGVRIINVLEQDGYFINLNPKCEPQLGTRGIYRGLRGQRDLPNREIALLWVLNLSDGSHTLLDIAECAHMAFDTIHDAAQVLVKHDLLQRADQPDDD